MSAFLKKTKKTTPDILAGQNYEGLVVKISTITPCQKQTKKSYAILGQSVLFRILSSTNGIQTSRFLDGVFCTARWEGPARQPPSSSLLEEQATIHLLDLSLDGPNTAPSFLLCPGSTTSIRKASYDRSIGSQPWIFLR